LQQEKENQRQQRQNDNSERDLKLRRLAYDDEEITRRPDGRVTKQRNEHRAKVREEFLRRSADGCENVFEH
jgi:hypothetical protein